MAIIYTLSFLPLLWPESCLVYLPDDMFSGLPGIRAVFIQDLGLLFLSPDLEVFLPYYLEIFIS